MKKIFYMAMAVAATVFAGCKENIVEVSKSGLQLTITADDSYVDKVVKSESAVDFSNFVVSIEKKDGKYTKEWTCAELPALIELASGEFTVTVASPASEPVAWNQPVYGAVKDFTIVEGVVTPVDIVCTLQNMKNSVYCSQHLVDELTTFQVTVTNPDGHLVWSADEVGIYTQAEDGTKTIVREPAKQGYFTVHDLDVTVNGYRAVDNSTATISYQIKDVAPRDHHILYVDAYVTGQSAIALSIDSSVIDRNVDMVIPGINPDDENVDDDIETGWGQEEDQQPGENQPVEPEQPVSTPPTLEWPANPDFAKMDIEQGMSVELMVYAPEKIKGFIVYVSDNFLGAIQMLVPGAKYLDLIYDEVAKDQLGTMLPVGDQLLGQTEVAFSLSKLVPMIAAVGNQGEDYIFTLEVTDEKDQILRKDVEFHNPVVTSEE
ncbi:MAG: DUF4493 domain-containing protein [Bacteroidales bacterium]|nr:DUF4493 domain-containing protein [Bacteroidales bacterium]